MSKFTVRVELHDADSNDYETLHDSMENKGFSRDIKDSKGKNYFLPTAEYNYQSKDEDRNDVLDKSKNAAKKTGKEFSILVTESAGRTWYGLDKS